MGGVGFAGGAAGPRGAGDGGSAAAGAGEDGGVDADPGDADVRRAALRILGAQLHNSQTIPCLSNYKCHFIYWGTMTVFGVKKC